MSESPIVEAARLICEGQLVAFPTETVYGLGANALDPAAVERIYEAKGRPASSPLIVHVSCIEMARVLARAWPETAERLAQRFWPGPLTLVVKKWPRLPDCVTAGLDTVGIRIPNHPVALELLHKACLPIAAPSANRFSQLSPTTAAHVRESLGDRVAMVLDGGPTQIGIESTVLSLAGPSPELLRPGMISQAQIEELIGPVTVRRTAPQEAHPSPGMHRKHYSPATRLLIVDNGVLPAGRGAYLWIRKLAAADRSIPMPTDAPGYAARLYDVLHQLDSEGLDWIAVERPPSDMMWAGILDRLERASQPD